MSGTSHTGFGFASELEDHPPFHQVLIGAITHLLAVFVPMVTPASIADAILQLFVGMIAYLTSTAIVASGISIWLQVNYYGIVDSGSFSIQSVNSSSVTVMITLSSSMRSDGLHEESIMPSLFGVSFVDAFLVIGSSFIPPYLRRVTTPAVSGTMALVIGLGLIKVGTIGSSGESAARGSGTFGNYEHLGAGLLALAVVIGSNCCHNPLLRMGGITIGLCVGYIASLCLDTVDSSNMHNLPSIIIPYLFEYGFSFNFRQFLVIDTIHLLSVLEAVSDTTATVVASRRPIQGKERQSRLKGGMLVGGLVSVIVSAVGLLSSTALTQNSGAIQITGVALHYVGRTTAVMLVILGLSPTISDFSTTIPSAVLRGVTTLMPFMTATVGIRVIITNSLKRRKTFIAATSLGLGPDVSHDLEISKILPAFIYVLVENPICVGGPIVILLDIILPGGY